MSTNSSDTATKVNEPVVSAKPAELEVTVYRSGPATFRERRLVSLGDGRNQVHLDGLAPQIVEGSLTVVSVEGQGKITLGPRSYRPATLNRERIIDGAKGTEVTLFEQTPQGLSPVRGKLRYVLNGQAVLELASGAVVLLPLSQKVELSKGLPGGLTEFASLLLEPTASQAGEFTFKVLYKADGFGWQPEYEVFYDAAGEKLTRFACYANLQNNAGANLDAAKLKLIDGVNRGGGRRHAMAKRGMQPMAASLEARSDAPQAELAMAGAEVQTVGEQKMYVLAEKLAVENGVPKQDAIVFAENVPVRPEYYLGHGEYYEVDTRDEDLPKLPVYVRLHLKNDAASKLGVSLPPANVRVLEPDSSGELQDTDSAYVSQHVSVGQPFRLDLQNPCKDLKATRKLTYLHVDPEVKVEDEDEQTPPAPPVMRPLDAAVTGGPDVGTPEADSRRKREIADAAAEKLEATEGGKKRRSRKKKVVPPRFQEEERQLTVFNYKDKDAVVLVDEYFPDKSEFLKKDREFDAKGQGTGSYKLTVPAKGQVQVTYRIKFRIN